VYLHQTPTPFAHLTVRENVAFPLRLRRVRGAELARRVDAALALVRLEALGERMPHTLSGGQRHRVALARAVAARPAVLLLDEPLSSLDPSLRDEVREAIVRAQAESGAALVLVTHDLDEAGLVAHRVAVLAERRLLQVAPPAELFARPASLAVARFLGVGAEVPGRVDAGAFRCALGAWRAPPGLADGPAVAVARPDALRLTGGPADAAGGCGTVVAVRHRARQTAARVRLDPGPGHPAGAPPAEVEAAVAPGDAPAVGARVRVAADPRAVAVFPAAPDPAARGPPVFDVLLRVLKDRLLEPLARLLGARVAPNAVTGAGLPRRAGAGAAAWRRAYGLALALWALNRLLDGLDGTLARVHGRQTDFGGYLDILLDFAVYTAVPTGLALGRPAAPVLAACAVLLGSFFVNAASWMYLSAVLERRGAGAAASGERTTVTMPPGLVAGTETVVLYTLFLLLPGRLVELFALMGALVYVTVGQRLVWARRHLR
jgi:ABC-type sulfate/molybdate transport systems ATPase subunit/phosphatidylglycerophosphate synthase